MERSDEERVYIRAVEFGVFSPEEIKRLSAACIHESSQYTGGFPTASGPNDFRLGSVPTRCAQE